MQPTVKIRTKHSIDTKAITRSLLDEGEKLLIFTYESQIDRHDLESKSYS